MQPVALLRPSWQHLQVTMSWQLITHSGELPPARRMHTATYMAATGKMVLFGGYGTGGVRFNDVWVLQEARDALLRMQHTRQSNRQYNRQYNRQSNRQSKRQ